MIKNLWPALDGIDCLNKWSSQIYDLHSMKVSAYIPDVQQCITCTRWKLVLI